MTCTSNFNKQATSNVFYSLSTDWSLQPGWGSRRGHTYQESHKSAHTTRFSRHAVRFHLPQKKCCFGSLGDRNGPPARLWSMAWNTQLYWKVFLWDVPMLFTMPYAVRMSAKGATSKFPLKCFIHFTKGPFHVLELPCSLTLPFISFARKHCCN
jgi:hypothetical protein